MLKSSLNVMDSTSILYCLSVTVEIDKARKKRYSHRRKRSRNVAAFGNEYPCLFIIFERSEDKSLTAPGKLDPLFDVGAREEKS